MDQQPPSSTCDLLTTNRKLHYSWIVLAVGTLGKIFTSPGQSPCIGVVINEIRESLDLSQTVRIVVIGPPFGFWKLYICF